VPATAPTEFCGQWRDKNVSPEQEERRELVRRFAVALAGTDNYGVDKVWEWAAKLADAEPSITKEQ
jgi:hypothetical protein